MGVEKKKPVLAGRNIVKIFRVFRKPRHRFISFLSAGRLTPPDTVKALDGVDFSLEKGAVLGIIGGNGAGKSTLLRIMAGVLVPDEGDFSSGGLRPTLLQLGAGFHSDLTGEENAGISAALHGVRAAGIKSTVKAIEEFAELGDFFRRPVRTYSQGMIFRLGFSVASAVEPDLLLIDETLAVGDEYFRAKCFDLLAKLRKNSVTMAIASHDLDLMRHFTTKVIVLESGRKVFEGDPAEGVDRLLERMMGRAAEDVAVPGTMKKPWIGEEISDDGISGRDGIGNGSGIFIGIPELLREDGSPAATFRADEPITIEFGYKSRTKIERPVFGIGIFRSDGVYMSGINHLWHKKPLDIPPLPVNTAGTVTCRLKKTGFAPGTYFVSVWCHDHSQSSPVQVGSLPRTRSFNILGFKPEFDGAVHLESSWKWKAEN